MTKARVKDKTINFNFSKVSKITKMNCLELLTVTSSFLDFPSFRKRERQRERDRERQTDRQTDRERQTETDRDRERQRETETQRDRES